MCSNNIAAIKQYKIFSILNKILNLIGLLFCCQMGYGKFFIFKQTIFLIAEGNFSNYNDKFCLWLFIETK